MSDPDYEAEMNADMGTCGEEGCIWCGGPQTSAQPTCMECGQPYPCGGHP